jgi:pimeloyl-ACP methyl ester carboxylesterase
MDSTTRWLSVALVTVAVLMPVRAAAQTIRMVDAGGHRLQMVLQGTGGPAVVFDAGMGGGMRGWKKVRDVVAKQTQTVIFERAGFGASEVGPAPRTARRIATELHTALANAGVTFPVVLVGHSAGGFFAVVFAALFPRDVAGLVLVDAATDATYDNMRDTDPKFWANRSDPGPWKADGMTPPPGWVGQMDALPESVEQYRASWPLPQIPTVVLTAMKPLGGSGPDSVVGTPTWARFQEGLVGRIPGAQQVVLPNENHVSILESPMLGEKVLEVVKRASAATGGPRNR